MARDTITESEHLQLIGLFVLHARAYEEQQRVERAVTSIVEPEKANVADLNLADTISQDELSMQTPSVARLLNRLGIEIVP